MSTIKLVERDYGHVLGLTLSDPDSNDAPIDVSTAVVRLYFKEQGANVLTATVVGTFTTDGTDGKVDFVWPEGALDNPGAYVGEIEIEVPGVKRQTVYDTLNFLVRRQEQIE